MPQTFWNISIPVIVGIIMLLINKLTTKGAAQISADIAELKRDGWTTDQKINLEKRLTLLEEIAKTLKSEVDFTKTSHQEFLRLLEKALIPVAHSPHTPELDRLLDKRNEGIELSAAEWEELIYRLGKEADEYNELPGKQVSLLGLRAIYLTHLKQAQHREANKH